MRLLAALSCMFVFLGSAAAQPSKSGPCALLTKAEVQEAVGTPVSEGVLNTDNKLVCDFKIGEAGSMINIMLMPKGPADSAERMVADLKKAKIVAVVIPGFGDSAYASSIVYMGMGTQSLGVYKGSNHVIVTVNLPGAPEAKAKAAAQAVMRKALARM